MTITTKAEYEKALERLEEIFNAKPGTPEGKELDQLTNSILSYEEEMELTNDHYDYD